MAQKSGSWVEIIERELISSAAFTVAPPPCSQQL